MLNIFLDLVLGSVEYSNNYNVNTPGTAGGPGGRDRTLAVKSRKIARKLPFFSGEKKITPKKYFFLHISSSYAKILGETNFHPEVGEK